MEWQVIADMAVGTAVLVGGVGLLAARLIALREFLFLALGFLIGMTFEQFLSFMGPGFISFEMEFPVPRAAIYVCHSLWDGGLFMGGYLSVWLLTRKPRGEICTAFDWRELAIMVAWGFLSSIVIEVIGNGIIWEYQQVAWNPVWLTIAGQGYTIFIQLVWLVAPVIFYFGCLKISRRVSPP